jgi:ubiquinone/menaquinone biosynthesis C-methylase UbiE
MATPVLRDLRPMVLAPAQGHVLEIGFGTGLNLPHYPETVRHLTAVDVNPGMVRRARRRIAESSIPVDHQVADVASLSMADATFDTVVSTWTLCSIPAVEQALAEMHRVLKPGGTFLFVEHGLSDDAGVQRWQRRLDPIQRVIADGCHLTRRVGQLVEAASFRIEALREFYLDGAPRAYGYTYHGVATK